MNGKLLKKLVCSLTFVAFLSTSVLPSYAQSVPNLPAPGIMVGLSESFAPAILKGMKVYPKNPLHFDFVIDSGSETLSESDLKEESTKLARYFLASLTVPNGDLWVNLSPYEGDRIIPDNFSLTEMGRDLLGQDYILKQLMSSLMYPESGIGKDVWRRIYDKAYEKYGTTDIPLDTFNKVWIVPDEATVYVNGDVAFIAKSYLNVMLDIDYVAFKMNVHTTDSKEQDPTDETRVIAQQAIREIVLPELEKEVNTGKNFAKLRQIFHAMVLSTWFKRNMQRSLIGQVYSDRNKVAGIDLVEKDSREKIWQQYVEAFKKGVFNYIKEEQDELTGEIIPRMYFSGGYDFAQANVIEQPRDAAEIADVASRIDLKTASVVLNPITDGGNNFKSPTKGPLVANEDEFEWNGQNNDFVIASNNPNIQNRSAHENFHEQARFSEVISDIASQIEASARNDGRYDLRSVAENAPNRSIVTSHGEIYLSAEGVLVIIDSRFQRDHAGRGERAVYAKNATKANHELVELKGWIAFAVKKGLATEEEIASGQVDLGLVLRNYLNGVGENLSVEQAISRREEIFQNRDSLHLQGLNAERGVVRSEFRGSPEGTLYRGTTRAQWEQILRLETPQSEFSTHGMTWVTLDLESATAYSRREGDAEAVIIAYKLSAHGKVSALTSYGDLRRQGVLSLEDVARVYDLKGNVLYDAESQTPSATGEGLDFIIAGKDNSDHAMIIKGDLLRVINEKAGMGVIGLTLAVNMRGYELEDAFQQFDEELGVYVIPDEVMSVLGPIGGMVDGQAFNLLGHIGLKASTVDLIRDGNEDAKYELHHEQSHNKYHEAHPDFPYQSIEQSLIDEIFAHLDGFITTYGVEKLFEERNIRFGDHDWFYNVLNILANDYVGKEVDQREQVVKRLSYAFGIIKLLFQKEQGDKIMAFIKQSTGLDELLGITPLGQQQWLTNAGIQLGNHETLRENWTKFNPNLQSDIKGNGSGVDGDDKSSDPSMLEENVGGIDLDSRQMNLQETGGRISFDTAADPAMLKRQINGFVPVVFSVRPLTDTQAFFAAPAY